MSVCRLTLWTASLVWKACSLQGVINSVRGGNEAYFLLSCLSGNGAKDVAEVLLTLKDKKWADKLDWHVAQ